VPSEEIGETWRFVRISSGAFEDLLANVAKDLIGAVEYYYYYKRSADSENSRGRNGDAVALAGGSGALRIRRSLFRL
jgi:hypothetical protein